MQIERVRLNTYLKETAKDLLKLLSSQWLKKYQLVANEQCACIDTNGSRRFKKSHASKLELIDYFRRKKGTTDNAIPEITKRITKEYLGFVVSFPDSSVIYLDVLPSTRSI